MKGYQYIVAKQTEWAKNNGICLIGSKVTRGRRAYTTQLDDNLFQSLLPDVRKSVETGDGKELGTSDLPGKMQAVHSSSALGINVFQYWKSISKVPTIATLCGFCRKGSDVSYDVRFEEKYSISNSFKRHPNIDVVIHNKPNAKIKRFAIECKFSEAYGDHGHDGLKTDYLQLDEIWDDIPTLKTFAQKISPDDKEFEHLHPAQLVKHILAMKRSFGRDGFRLLYLWYDVFGEQDKRHQDEIAKFARIAKKDKIKFHSLSYQELIVKLAKHCRSDHQEYIQYLTERYL